MNETDYTSANVLSRLFSSISVDKLRETSDVLSAWQETLRSIKGFQNDGTKPADYGSQLADHSRIVDLQKGILIVETDHPGRIQMFQLYKNFILNGLKKKLPECPISNIVFKLKKVETVTGCLRMPTKEELDKAAERNDSAAGAQSAHSKQDGQPAQNSEEKQNVPLAPELQAIFDQMKADLT